MKIIGVSLFFLSVVAVAACSKSDNSYATTDNTVGMIKSWNWTGTATGYTQGDSVIHPLPDTTHVPWPKHFSRNISDTALAITRINGYCVAIMGVSFNYLSTDSALTKTVVYDTILPGAARCYLKFYYAHDSMTLEYHEVSGYNATANQYYQQNWLLHSVSH
jgi:hypothetical protein